MTMDLGSFSWPASGGGGGGVVTLNGLLGVVTIAGGTGITVGTAGQTITITATGSELTFADSIVNNAGVVTLVNDSASPAASSYYGTDAGSVLGYYSLPVGSVTSVSVVSANGLAGTVATATSTPAITLRTTITGILQGNGTAISAATTGDLTDAGTDGITITSGTGSVLGSGTSISQHVADTTHNGYLSSTDWNTFNGKQDALTIGDLTDVGTDGITVTNGTGAVIGTGTSIAQQVSDASHNGYLSSTDWTTFNSKLTSTLASADIFVGNGSNVAAAVSMGGDATLDNMGDLTLATVASAGTTGSSTSIPSVTINVKGLVTSVTGNAVIAPAGTLSGTTLNATVVTSSLTSIGTITTGVWNGTAIDVAHGGTGDTSLTAYAVLCGGTTTTGAVQSIASVGTAAQVLTSNGAGALPTFQDAPATPRSYVTYDSFNSRGGSSSGDANVLNFSNQRQSVGSNITYTARTTTTGDKFTVNANGLYAVSFNTGVSGSSTDMGIVVNSSATSSNPQSLTYAQGLRAISNSGNTSQRGFVGWTGYLNSGDVIQIQVEGVTCYADAETMITITQVAG